MNKAIIRWNHNKFILKVIKRLAHISQCKNFILIIFRLRPSKKIIIELRILCLKNHKFKKSYIFNL